MLQNFFSTGRLDEGGIEVLTKNGELVISRGDNVLYRQKKIRGLYPIYHKPVERSESVAFPVKKSFLSVQVWHERLNHCKKKKLLRTLGDLVNKQEVEDFYNRLCVGCVERKGHRTPIPKKLKNMKIEDILSTLVGDAIGPFITSIDRKSVNCP